MSRLKQVKEVLGVDQNKVLPIFITADDNIDFEALQRQNPQQKMFYLE